MFIFLFYYEKLENYFLKNMCLVVATKKYFSKRLKIKKIIY